MQIVPYSLYSSILSHVIPKNHMKEPGLNFYDFGGEIPDPEDINDDVQ